MERHDLHGCSQSQCAYSLVEECQIAYVSKMPLIRWCLDNFFDQLNGVCLNVNICSVFVQYCLYFLYFPLAKSLKPVKKLRFIPFLKKHNFCIISVCGQYVCFLIWGRHLKKDSFFP